MPKATLVPCPDCGESGFTVFIQELSGEWQGHCGCGHTTRYCKTREAAIAAWNALPRALRWTHEPPRVAGKYWWRDKRRPDEDSIINVTETKLDGYRRNPIGEYEQFAGPIPPPIG